MIKKKKAIIKKNKLNKILKLKKRRKYITKKRKQLSILKKYFSKIKFIIFILILLFIAYSGIYKIPFIKKYKSLDEKQLDILAEKIYKSKGKLSFDELEKNNKKIDYSKYDNVHIAMSFNNDYYLLTTVTIASILKTSAPNTYAHIHIIEAGDFIHETRKNISSLKYKINNNSEFVFYDGTKAMDDFGKEIKDQFYGVGEYARLMAPDLVDADRVIVIDSGDVIAKKDLVEFYNIDLQDKLVWGALDPFAPCFFNDLLLHNKENYINSGVLLFNSKKWREMNIYNDIVNFYKAFNFKGRLGLPIQDILNTFLPYLSVGVLPLRYNFQYHPYISAGCVKVKGEEVQDAHNNEVLRHNNKEKPQNGDGDFHLWYYYVNLTGFIDEICKKFPQGCRQ